MSPDFTTSTGLRMLLTELHYAGPDAWRYDPAAAALIAHAKDKYAALAHKHGLDADDAAYAAFEALRTSAVRTAQDPWAVTTRAVQISLTFDERADGLLCSTAQARREEISANHDAIRFGEQETSLLDYHPAFWAPPLIERGGPKVSLEDATDRIVRLYVILGWPEHVIRHALSFIGARLISSGNRATAHAGLRKDLLALRALDLPQRTWTTVLTSVLGNPDPDCKTTKRGLGLWYRVLRGTTVTDLLDEDDVVNPIVETAPALDPIPRLQRMFPNVA